MSNPQGTFPRTLPNLNVGTIGHHLHGKTTLSAALTRVLTPLYQGRNRSLSIQEIVSGGFRRRWALESTAEDQKTIIPNKLEYETPRRHYTHADLPGMRRYYRNTARGLSELDAVILVVAADSSLMAQSREHLLLARAMGIQRAIVFLNKCDLVSDEAMLDLVEAEAREALLVAGFSGNEARVLRGAALPAYHGDARWTPTLLSLAEALDLDLPQPAAPEGQELFFEITEHYPAKGARGGPVVLGRLQRGTLQRGETLRLLGRGEEAREVVVTDLEICREKSQDVLPGEIAGLLLRPLREEKQRPLLPRRGQLLVRPGTAPLRQRFTARLSTLPTAHGGRHTPFFDGHQVQLYLGADDVTANLRLDEWSIGVEPGTTATVEVQLSRPAWIEPGKRFAARDGCDGFRHLHGGVVTWGGTLGTGVVEQILA